VKSLPPLSAVGCVLFVFGPALVAADHVLVPVEVENFAVRSLATTEDDYHAVKQLFNARTTIHYFLSKVSTSSKTHERSRQMLTHALGEQNVFKTAIPLMATYKSAINVRKPITVHKPKTKAAQIMRDFAAELLGVSYDHADQAAA
jgi:cellulose biosynthesis protein BcsQ